MKKNILFISLMPCIMAAQSVKLTDDIAKARVVAAPSFTIQKEWCLYQGTDGAKYYMFMVYEADELKVLYNNLITLLKVNNEFFDNPSANECEGESLDINNLDAFYEDVMYGKTTVYKEWLLEPERGELGDKVEFRLMPNTFHIILKDAP